MNKTPNENFLEDNEEVEYEEVPESELEEGDEVLEELEDEMNGIENAAQETLKAISEAEKRIEQANLYKAVLNGNLFGKGSARPEIIKIVDKEFKAFVMYRLEVLLGIKAEGGLKGPQQQVQVASPFSPAEIAALKAIAARLNKTAPPQQTQQQAQPVINQIGASQEEDIQPVTQSAPQQTGERMVRRVVKKTAQAPAQTARKPKKPRTNNVSEITGQDLGQASNPARPPVPMPSATMMNAMNAELAEKNARGGVQATHGAMAGHIQTLVKG